VESWHRVCCLVHVDIQYLEVCISSHRACHELQLDSNTDNSASLFDSNVEEQELQSRIGPHPIDCQVLPMCRTIKDSVTECQCDVDSNQISKATEVVICKTQVPASSPKIDFTSEFKEAQQSDPLFDSNVEEQPHPVDCHLLPMCRM